MWELLVRISNFKYRETGVCESYSTALEKLITENILPHAQQEPWQKFRDDVLWTIDVNDILEANLENIKKIYNTYTGAHKK